MNEVNRKPLYLMFFMSGFCSLVCQMVWTRLAFAFFGITTPVLSVVLSVFMLGLSAGAWTGGRVISRLTRQSGLSAICFYGAAELLIGVGALATPALFALGQRGLLAAGQTDSFRYLFLSALVLAASILPWCLCMGATFPWMMAYVRERETCHADSFSFLYFANVLGAMTGTVATAFVLVETLGFHHTLAAAAAGNFAIAALVIGIGLRGGQRARAPEPAAAAAKEPVGGRMARWILFTTGFCAMAMEVVWTRAFTPVLKTQVYSFALIVFAYLGATGLGSLLYRRHVRRQAGRPLGELAALLGLASLLPVIAVDPRTLPWNWRLSLVSGTPNLFAVAILLASICPLCAVLGYLTPSLIDQYAAGHPKAAGKAYGINVIGCIVGPLCASYLLLPRVSERCALVVLALPLLGLGLLTCQSLLCRQRWTAAALAGALLAWTLFIAQDAEEYLHERGYHAVLRRDYAASVLSYGQGFQRSLMVNGMGMTALTSDTKTMVHLPMALHKGKPESVLIICFGMGTSFRAALSWGVPTTAVELVPSVVKAFPFYHADALAARQNPKGKIVIDDGRRFLLRTREKFDVIVVDPPPPVEAAGSSLLYSRQFCDLARERLNPHGILQIWFPGGSEATIHAVARSVAEAFPYVRVFSRTDSRGLHFLASTQPIGLASAAQLASRLPPAARKDMLEWAKPDTSTSLADYFQYILNEEMPIAHYLVPDLRIQVSDDEPFNEYYLLRDWGVTSR